MKKESTTGGLVYSSEYGRMCPGCASPIDRCACQKAGDLPKGDGVLRIGRESNGRGGKTVTTVKGFQGSADAAKTLLADVKKRCGTGGTLKDGVLEIQGDHRDTILDLLTKKGLKAKKAGG
jgi:translation initiation factor 1